MTRLPGSQFTSGPAQLWYFFCLYFFLLHFLAVEPRGLRTRRVYKIHVGPFSCHSYSSDNTPRYQEPSPYLFFSSIPLKESLIPFSLQDHLRYPDPTMPQRIATRFALPPLHIVNSHKPYPPAPPPSPVDATFPVTMLPITVSMGSQ